MQVTYNTCSNVRNQEVGQLIYHENELAYLTTRDKRRGEIFSIKNTFNGVVMENPIAVDLDILKKLFANNVKSIIFCIRNLEETTFYGKVNLATIMENGITINYDKSYMKLKYGTQKVFSMNLLERIKL